MGDSSHRLEVTRQMPSSRLAQFPLSTAHYIETWRATDPARLRRLAEAMLELSV